MIEDIIYFIGSNENAIFLIFFGIFAILTVLFALFCLDNFYYLFIPSLIIFLICTEFFFWCSGKFSEIDKKRHPCDYPKYIYHYQYIDTHGNEVKFDSNDRNSCSYRYDNYQMFCYYNNTYVKVDSFSYEEEAIYLDGC